jgi:hypothetical protein
MELNGMEWNGMESNKKYVFVLDLCISYPCAGKFVSTSL